MALGGAAGTSPAPTSQPPPPEAAVAPATATDSERALYNLFNAIRPVKLSNCQFERFGDSYDGGYVMCANLMGRAESLYSYGISATDNWGCTLSARLKKPVHQYDCFDLKRPDCDGATPMFHEECVGGKRETIEGRLFDTVEAQLARNGDAGKRVVVKMDVEGSEWESFLTMPESVMQQIDQLSVEFHDVRHKDALPVINRLKTVFHVVNVHYNNYTCDPAAKPLPATVFELLLVNKNLGVVEEGATPEFPNPLDAPNSSMRQDCQVAATESKSPR
jgi:hypothetical protein